MEAVFLQLTNMGITAGWIVLGLLLVRLLIRKAPKWIACLLWGVVGLRLVLPVTPVSNLSLLPSAQPIPMDITSVAIPRVQTGIPVVNNVANPVLEKTPDLPGIIQVLAVVWAAGVGVMLLYGVISYLLLRRKVAASAEIEPGVYICDYVDNPFVLGVFRPGIYLPADLEDNCKAAVLAHERAHLRRRDHWWKPLGYVLLSVYWFNPLLWLAYILLCRDIESACDEKVIKTMDLQERKDYSLNLAQCSTHRIRILTCPVAFGEVGVKARIRAVLSYKKPAFWVVVGAAVLCMAAAICLLTVPEPCNHQYVSQITVESTCTEEGICTYTCSLCEDIYKEPVAMLDHSYDEGQITEAATCTEEGLRMHSCISCGNQRTEPVAMLAHTYGVGQVITQADCVQPGLQRAACTVCGGVAEVPIGISDEHRFTNTVIRKATCVDPGEGVNTCTLCGIQESCTYELTEHNYVDGLFAIVKLNKVSQQKKCTVCNAAYWIEESITHEHEWNSGPYGGVHCKYCGTIKWDSEYSSHKYPGVPWYSDVPSFDPNPFPVIEWDFTP